MPKGDATADVLAGNVAGRGRDRQPGGHVAAILSGDQAHAYRQTPAEAAETNVSTVHRSYRFPCSSGIDFRNDRFKYKHDKYDRSFRHRDIERSCVCKRETLPPLVGAAGWDGVDLLPRTRASRSGLHVTRCPGFSGGKRRPDWVRDRRRRGTNGVRSGRVTRSRTRKDSGG